MFCFSALKMDCQHYQQRVVDEDSKHRCDIHIPRWCNISVPIPCDFCHSYVKSEE
jgi:hypothetical protein